MAIYACILAKVDITLSLDAVRHLESLPSVGLVVPTTGPYDLLILAKSEDPDSLGRAIITEYQTAPGIESTLTLFILKELKPLSWLLERINLETN